jgi:hypothetical protein
VVSLLLGGFVTTCPNLRLDPSAELSFYGARGFVQHGTDALPVFIGAL